MLVLPSPNCHSYVYGSVPPLGVHANATSSGASPDVGVAEHTSETTPVTVISELVQVAVWDSESVTVTVATNAPAMEYVWLGFCDVLVPASPKLQAYVYGAVPPLGVQANATSSGASPDVGDAVPVTDNGAETTIDGLVQDPVCDRESVTTTVALRVPAVVYV